MTQYALSKKLLEHNAKKSSATVRHWQASKTTLWLITTIKTARTLQKYLLSPTTATWSGARWSSPSSRGPREPGIRILRQCRKLSLQSPRLMRCVPYVALPCRINQLPPQVQFKWRDIWFTRKTSPPTFQQSFHVPRWLAHCKLRATYIHIRWHFLVLGSTCARSHYQSIGMAIPSIKLTPELHRHAGVPWSKVRIIKTRLIEIFSAPAPYGDNSPHNAQLDNTRHQDESLQSREIVRKDGCVNYWARWETRKWG